MQTQPIGEVGFDLAIDGVRVLDANFKLVGATAFADRDQDFSTCSLYTTMATEVILHCALMLCCILSHSRYFQAGSRLSNGYGCAYNGHGNSHGLILADFSKYRPLPCSINNCFR